jgi:hypothetical protein
MKFDLLTVQALLVATGILAIYFGQRAFYAWRDARRHRSAVRDEQPPV